MSEAEDEVRRLLSQARHTEPLPAEVAARLDQRLAELSLPPVDDELAAVRRRRAAALLVAAVAIVAVGIGAGNLIRPEPADMASTSVSEEGAGESAPQGDAAGAEQSSETAPGPGETPDGRTDTTMKAPASQRLALADLEIVQVPVRLHAEHLGRDVRVVVEDVRLADGATMPNPDAVLASYGCEVTAFGEGTLVAAMYDDQPAILALRPPEGRNQIVDVVACGTGEELASLTVPVE